MRPGVQVCDVDGPDPEILVRGSKRDVTPWEEATLLRLVATAPTHPSRDWVPWIARHGLLRHFEPT